MTEKLTEHQKNRKIQIFINAQATRRKHLLSLFRRICMRSPLRLHASSRIIHQPPHLKFNHVALNNCLLFCPLDSLAFVTEHNTPKENTCTTARSTTDVSEKRSKLLTNNQTIPLLIIDRMLTVINCDCFQETTIGVRFNDICIKKTVVLLSQSRTSVFAVSSILYPDRLVHKTFPETCLLRFTIYDTYSRGRSFLAEIVKKGRGYSTKNPCQRCAFKKGVS